MAVCGIVSPSGCRNSAVTANQSASPPTSDASAVARTYPSQGYWPSNALAPANTEAASARSPVGRRFIAASCAWRTASSGRDHEGEAGEEEGGDAGVTVTKQ